MLRDYDTAKESTHYTFAPTQTRQQQDPWAMDVDMMELNRIQKGKGECFYCGKPGHWANNCFLKKKEGSSTGSSRPGRGPHTNNFQKKKSGFAWKKGKGRKFKKQYVRSAGMEEEGEEEDEQDEEDDADTYICHLGKEIKKMDKRTKIRVLAALQEDF